MKLSVCVITKNEEKNIATCLNSVKSIASEIIVVDTGSTDNTVSIAKSLGAKTFYFKWEDDFSKAKNHAISKVRGDWILFLDADEYIFKDSLQSIIPTIKMAITKKAQLISCLLSNYEKDGNRFINSLKTTRLFKRHSKIYYTGAIHETVTYTNKGEPITIDASQKLQIIHTGYSLEDTKEKNKGERNLNLLFKELEKDPNNGFLHFYISESYSLIRNYKKALKHAYIALDLNNLPLHVGAKNYKNIINCMNRLKYPKNGIRQKIKEALKEHPDFSDLYYIYAEILKHENQINDAIDNYELAVENIDSAFKFQSLAVNYLIKVYQSLADLYYQVDQISKSVKNHVEVLKIDPNDSHSLKEILRILDRHESSENIIRFLGKIYNYEDVKDILVILQASLQINSASLSTEVLTLLNEGQRNRLQKESTYIQFLKGQYEYSSLQFKEIFLNTYEHETSVFCFVAAELANKKEILEEIYYHVNPSLAKVINKILGNTDVKIWEEDHDEVINIIKQYIKLEHIDKVSYFLDFLPETKWNQIAELLYTYEKYEAALELFNKYLEHENDISSHQMSNVLTRMGKCLYKLGNLELSVQFLEEAMNLNSKDYTNYETAIIALNKMGAQDRLEKIAKKASEYFPDSNFIQSYITDDNFLKELEKKIENDYKEQKLRNEVKDYRSNIETSKMIHQVQNLKAESNNNKLLLEKEFKHRLERIQDAKKQILMLRNDGSKEKIHIVYVMTHVGICGGVKIILEHANRLKQLGMKVSIVSHYPVPTWFPVEVNYIEVSFDVELATGIPNCDVIVATYWNHIQACIDTEIAPVIYFEQGDFHIFDYEKVNKTIKDFIYKQYQLPNFIFTVSNQCAELIKEIYNRDASVIHNAIDSTLFNCDKKEIVFDKKYILMVGNPQLPFKGINEIIKSYKIVKSKIPDVKLYLITPVEPSKEIEDMIDKIFVSPTQQQIADLYKGASMYVSASHYESFSLPVLEAMSCGCPVVTTGNNGVLEYAKDNNNVLITRIGDYHEAAKKIMKVLRNVDLKNKLISNGLLTAEKFDWKHITTQLLKLYRDIARYEVNKTKTEAVVQKVGGNMYGVYIGDNKMLIKSVWGGKLMTSNKDMSLMPDLVANGVIEGSLTKFFMNNIKEGDTVIDIGANIGYYTILTGFKVGKNGKVIAFEANESSYSFLIDNVSINYLADRVTLLNKAVYSQEQELSLFTTERFSGNASIHRPDQEYYDYFLVDQGMKEKKVQAVSLDTFIDKKEIIDFIKIDVEGGEYHCLLGMQDLVSSKRVKTVIFELNKLRSREDSEKLYNLLMNFQNQQQVKFGVINNDGIMQEHPLEQIFKHDFIPSVVMNVK